MFELAAVLIIGFILLRILDFFLNVIFSGVSHLTSPKNFGQERDERDLFLETLIAKALSDENHSLNR